MKLLVDGSDAFSDLRATPRQVCWLLEARRLQTAPCCVVACESPGSYQRLTPHKDLLPDIAAQLREAAWQLCFLHLVLL